MSAQITELTNSEEHLKIEINRLTAENDGLRLFIVDLEKYAVAYAALHARYDVINKEYNLALTDLQKTYNTIQEYDMVNKILQSAVTNLEKEILKQKEYIENLSFKSDQCDRSYISAKNTINEIHSLSETERFSYTPLAPSFPPLTSLPPLTPSFSFSINSPPEIRIPTPSSIYQPSRTGSPPISPPSTAIYTIPLSRSQSGTSFVRQ